MGIWLALLFGLLSGVALPCESGKTIEDATRRDQLAINTGVGGPTVIIYLEKKKAPKSLLEYAEAGMYSREVIPVVSLSARALSLDFSSQILHVETSFVAGLDTMGFTFQRRPELIAGSLPGSFDLPHFCRKLHVGLASWGYSKATESTEAISEVLFRGTPTETWVPPKDELARLRKEAELALRRQNRYIRQSIAESPARLMALYIAAVAEASTEHYAAWMERIKLPKTRTLLLQEQTFAIVSGSSMEILTRLAKKSIEVSNRLVVGEKLKLGSINERIEQAISTPGSPGEREDGIAVNLREIISQAQSVPEGTLTELDRQLAAAFEEIIPN